MRQRMKRRPTGFESLESRRVLAAAPLITEFVASNGSSAEDGFGKDPDWIEIFNAGDESVDLLGYHLTDSASQPTKWSFSSSTVLDPGDYLLVFASSLDVQDPAGYWHTNFRLSGDGEYLALVAPDGERLSQFGSASEDYPAQFSDVSFGIGSTQLVTGDSPAHYWIPRSDELGTLWTQPDIDIELLGFTEGQAAVGFDQSNASSSYNDFIRTEVPDGTTGVYVRTEFELDNAAIPDLSLNLLYDDGIVVYLNGTQVFTDQDETPIWNSLSDKERRDRIVLEGFELDLSEHRDLLRTGNNVLAFHLMNRTATSADLVVSPLLTTSQSSDEFGYLDEPTPLAANGGVIALGPAIRDVTLQSDAVEPDQPLIVTADIRPTLGNVDPASVTLNYRVMFGDTNTTRMWDDGQGIDQDANDGVFTAMIPGGIAAAGEMVRWYVTATDESARPSREPRFVNQTDSAEYFGTVFSDPTASNDIPVVYWFVNSASAARTRTGTRASLSIGGEFYDNVKVDLHGQSTSAFVKTSYDFDANQGQKFKLTDDLDRVSDFNLITNYGDQTKLRNSLAYGAHAAAGGASHFTYPVEVHQNGEFFGLYDIVEQGDTEYLERIGLDPNGALYKVNNRLDSTTNNVDKVSRRFENNDDLQALVDANQMSNTSGLVWDYDNLDIADMVNYLAVQSLIMNRDFGHKNMYWYYDVEGTQLWSPLPWDVDLSFGHIWNSSDRYFDDTLFTSGELRLGLNNLLQRFYADDNLESMYYRRLRTLMDQQLGEKDTPILESYTAQKAIALEALIADEAQRDYEKWGIDPGFSHTPSEAAQQLLTEYLEPRRDYLERNRRIPDAHGPVVAVTIEAVDYEPTSGRVSEQYIELRNQEAFAVDISGWELAGATQHTFKSGSVIAPNSSLFLVANPAAFKARSEGPRGGQKLFMQANTSGTIPEFGALTLYNAERATVAANSFGTEFLLGDTNGDEQLDADDIDTLRNAIATAATESIFDLNADSVVNEADLDYLIEQVFQTRRGDANLDGQVDFSDFLILSANFGKVDKTWQQGNFDLDNRVQFFDFLLLSASFGEQ